MCSHPSYLLPTLLFTSSRYVNRIAVNTILCVRSDLRMCPLTVKILNTSNREPLQHRVHCLVRKQAARKLRHLDHAAWVAHQRQNKNQKQRSLMTTPNLLLSASFRFPSPARLRWASRLYSSSPNSPLPQSYYIKTSFRASGVAVCWVQLGYFMPRTCLLQPRSFSFYEWFLQ